MASAKELLTPGAFAAAVTLTPDRTRAGHASAANFAAAHPADAGHHLGFGPWSWR